MEFPRLIVFEGADGAGKSSICKRFAEVLADRDIEAKTLSFPGKEPGTLGNLVYKIHHDASSQGIEQVAPASLQALHIAAHLDTIETTILPRLEAGETILLDRYWWSTWFMGFWEVLIPKFSPL